MKKIVGLLFALSLAACSRHDSNEPLKKALQKQNIKNLVPEKILSTQNAEVDNWFTKDPDLDNVEGVSADKAYANLDLKHKKEIIVAVIDSGVDIHHEDLQGKIWVNTKEIPNNGIDDDGNGYIDDVNGWNFIGGYDANGKPVDINYEQLEVTRELVRYKKKKAELQKEGKDLSDKEQAYLDQVSQEVQGVRESDGQAVDLINNSLDILKKNYEVIKDLLNIPFEEMTRTNVVAINATTDEQKTARQNIIDTFDSSGAGSVSRFLAAKANYDLELNYYYNEDFNPRKSIVKDNPDDLTDVHYGNNDVIGPDADHGTHVAGIIAANRDNGIGIKGIAQDVKIMVIRVVPNGDERDKDVALGVRYAADNGANIINMSFGKPYSPQRYFVGEAFKYAESKGVLIVHAAGNESMNKDTKDNYPTRRVYNKEGLQIELVEAWLDVGASSQYNNRNLTAAFSNYGQYTVDFFAPGVALKSSITGNRYAIFSGTSMASPATAGVAALVWSERPELGALQLKDLLFNTTRSRAGLMVGLPGLYFKDVPFQTLSITGGIVDAYSALTAQ